MNSINFKQNILLYGLGLVLLAFVAGYLGARIGPSIEGFKGSGASVLVLGCIDPRYANSLAWYLTHTQELKGDYDLFTLAGAALGVLQNQFPHWGQTFHDHVGLAIALHDIQEIWVFDHMDCGAYKKLVLGGLDQPDTDEKVHLDKLKELQAELKSKYPQLGFKGYIISVNGTVKNVIDASL
jgi:carbonic anhydrase